ncbi:MAG: dihydrodipicolinate synthase family protein [Gemmatimonadaceae bacterium]|nr:dihydrodipicolinate synthase family protein [Gemmatimonadaceae bacterium]
MAASDGTNVREHLLAGQVIPAHPLALTPARELDERRQRALTRYYLDAGAGGIAVGVHTTQFAIRDSAFGLYRPVLEIAMETVRERLAVTPRPFVAVAGIAGTTRQAVGEAQVAATIGYDIALVSLGALRDADPRQVVAHCRAVAEVLPVFGFYLQPAVGGRVLPYAFWRDLASIDRVWAIKIAPFNRYQTWDVVRAVAESGRDDIALYTGNDDNILADLLTPFPVVVGGQATTRRLVGGLLGQWAVGTRHAVDLLARVKSEGDTRPASRWLAEAAALTDANAAVFDAANAFSGCIPGIHEILRRQGLMRGTWCLDVHEQLSPGQRAEIDRVYSRYDVFDGEFVAEHLAAWLA